MSKIPDLALVGPYRDQAPQIVRVGWFICHVSGPKRTPRQAKALQYKPKERPLHLVIRTFKSMGQRVLLPRESDAPVATLSVPGTRAAAPTIPAPVADPATATAVMLTCLLNQPNGMVAQQGLHGLDIAQLLQQTAVSQQVQAQQGQLLQALQMQQLFQAAQQSTGMLVQNTPAPGAATFSNMFLPTEPVPQANLMPPMTIGCTEGAPASALPKARKNGKVRRLRSAARIAKPATEVDAPAVDVGRPAPTDA